MHLLVYVCILASGCFSYPLQVDIKEQPAIEALQQLLQSCEEPGSFDFVFIGKCCVIVLPDCHVSTLTEVMGHI